MNLPETRVAQLGDLEKVGGNMRHHQSKKNLANNFEHIWRLLNAFGRQSLMTPNSHTFDAFATLAIKGTHEGEKVIRIEKDGQEFARIYPCCWGHTTNCYGTRIGGYSDALDQWAARTKKGLSPPTGPGGNKPPQRDRKR